MRNSYTAGMVVELLARNLNFGRVYGISAGSSHTVNYLVRDAVPRPRVVRGAGEVPALRRLGQLPRAAHGYFNGPYLYEELIENAPAGDPMAFDWDTFACQSGRHAHRGHGLGHRRDRRLYQSRYAGRPRPGADGARIVHHAPFHAAHHHRRAHLRGRRHGRQLGHPAECGTRPTATSASASSAPSRAATARNPWAPCDQRLFRAAFRKHPIVAERTIARWQPYNELCNEIERLEKIGGGLGFLPRHHGRHQHAPPTTTPSFAPTKPASPKPSATSPPSWSGWAKQCLSKKETPAKCGGFPSTPIAGNVSEVPTGAWNCPALGPSWLRPTPSPKQGARPGACRNRSVESFDVGSLIERLG